MLFIGRSMMRLDTFVAEDDVGAGVPELPKPKVVGGLAGNIMPISKSPLNDDSNERICRICLDDESTP